jgi:hypothetical protein
MIFINDSYLKKEILIKFKLRTTSYVVGVDELISILGLVIKNA